MQASAKSHQLESVFDIPQEVSGSYEIEEILNIPYMNRHEVALGMDIYKPVMPETAEMPVIVTLYGGGLVQGDRKSSRPRKGAPMPFMPPMPFPPKRKPRRPGKPGRPAPFKRFK